jgi:hypothetical protein
MDFGGLPNGQGQIPDHTDGNGLLASLREQGQGKRAYGKRASV